MAKRWPAGMPEVVTLRQGWELCGRPGCWCRGDTRPRPGHGPHWYAYWRQGDRLRRTYLGTAISDRSGPLVEGDGEP